MGNGGCTRTAGMLRAAAWTATTTTHLQLLQGAHLSDADLQEIPKSLKAREMCRTQWSDRLLAKTIPLPHGLDR